MKKLKNNKGFTLIELVVVIAILAILALILVPAIGKYIGDANISKNKASARTIYSNAVLENSKGTYTKSTETGHDIDLDEAVEKLSNAATGTVDVTLKDGSVVSIVYRPDGDKDQTIIFDGKTFSGTLTLE